ncbi:hypothetical protein [Rugamonas apoptosis]|uniref:HEAT repeat domain-containing protein n=1 Tax=Rugamonas apoptosis TaxID=2758570 RepID=A0A7W2FE54_9BURK|nr:hypothetical protein [Rugamonas apoptosis]MBA5689969.1 hypothetical protein [Rugamonas apoptosis]
MKRQPSMTAAELAARLQASPVFAERKQIQEQERTDRLARMRIEEEPILKELRGIGWDLKSVWDLVNTSEPYPEAIPILLHHLQLPYSDLIKEGIARSLAVPEQAVQEAWPILLGEYRKAPTGMGMKVFGDAKEFRLAAKDGLACALAVTVTDETLPELVALAKDRIHGESRVLLLSALKKRKNRNPVVRLLIDELAKDPDLQKEISSWGSR